MNDDAVIKWKDRVSGMITEAAEKGLLRVTVNYRHPKGWQLAKLPVIPRETYSAIGRLTCGLPSRFSGCRRAAL